MQQVIRKWHVSVCFLRGPHGYRPLTVTCIKYTFKCEFAARFPHRLGKPTCRSTTQTILSQNVGFLNCRVTMSLRKPFAWICFAQIFGTAFCTDFLHGVFCADFCADFLHGFPKPLVGKRQKNQPRKSPQEFTMLWGTFGERLGRQEAEVETLANLTGQSL